MKPDSQGITPETINDLRQESERLASEFLDRADDAGILWSEYRRAFDRQEVLDIDLNMRGMFERALAECISAKTS